MDDFFPATPSAMRARLVVVVWWFVGMVCPRYMPYAHR